MIHNFSTNDWQLFFCYFKQKEEKISFVYTENWRDIYSF